ncbi:MAG TPA: hypothetical protein VF432_21875 [Thermoanaerobaculia bacterium]
MIRKLHSMMFVAAACLLPVSFASADDFRPIPNSVKYKDSSIANAKGSSGSASIQVRALFNKDETTDVEITTGVFDEPGTASGTIKNVHIDVNGQTHDFNGNGGSTFTATGLAGLAPGATVGVHVNVKDLAGGNQSIRVSATVKKRPDLTFVWIQSTQHAMVGLPVNIVATIHEQNRQSGARADCVAYENGVEVDRADDIWIDAGGTVDCVLAPAFAQPGWKDILVKVEHVRPGDWDLADNQVYAHTTVHAYDEEVDSWSATARDETSSYYSRYYGRYSDEVSSSSGWRSGASVDATQPEFLNPNNMTMDFSITTDGVSFTDLQGIRFEGWEPGERHSCGRAFIGATRATICTMQRPWEIGTDRGYTQISASTNNGDVTYYSRSWWVWYDSNGTPNYYTYEGTWRDQSGNGQRLGNTVAMRMSVTDGTRTLWAEPFITLQPSEIHDSYEVCWSSGSCEEYRRDLILKYGTARGGLNN